MRKHKKILFALTSLTGIFLCLLLILVVVTPKLVNLDTVKKEIKSQYARDIGGQIEYQHIDLALLPRPHIVISDVNFTLPDKVDGTLQSLDVYPKILPIFTGKIQIGRLRSRSAEINIRFPETSDDESRASDSASFETHGAQLVSIIRSLPEFKIPAIVLKIHNGRAHFFEGKNRILSLQNINGKVKRKTDRFEFTLNCQSNFWENMEINGRYAEPGFKISSRIKITQLRPHAVADYFFPQSDLKMLNARANLTLDLQTNGPEDLQATIDGSIPYLHLRKGKKDLKLADATFKGGYQLKNKALTLSLSQLNLKDPRLTLSGQLVADPASPDIQLEIEGRQINVETTQRIALALTEDVDTVNEVYEIMRSGEFQRVTLKAQGPTLADLAGGDNYVIEGNMVGGNIFIPGVELNLEDVTGDARIIRGILQGENIQARMGNSHGTKGKLAIPLTGDTAPFHVEGLIQADLSELPPVLLRVIDDDDLKKELALLDKVSGRAVGMLELGEDTKDLNVRVMASDIQLDAVYRRIPFPLKIDGGSLLLDGNRIALTDINAGVGKSSLSRLSAKFRWQKGASFEMASKSAGIDLGEVYAWLSQEKKFQQNLKNITAVNGNVSLYDFELKGPFAKPRQWQVRSNGDLRELSMSSALLPGKLTVAKGQFTCKGDRFSIKNVNAVVGKSSISALAADLKWGRQVTLTANSAKTAIFLDEVYPWLKSHKALRPSLKDIPPLTGILAFQNLAFTGPISGKTNQNLSLTGTIEKWNISSPKFPTSFVISGGELVWRGARFDLRDSNARFGESTIVRLAFGMKWGKAPSYAVRADSANILIAELYSWLISFHALEEAFKGFKATQGRLVLSGLDIKGPVGRSGAWQFHLAGGVTGIGVESDYFKESIQIHSAKFALDDTTDAKGIQGQIDLTDMQVGWEDSRINLNGALSFSENKLILDMDLAADQINWGQIEQIVEIEGKPESGSTVVLLGELRVDSESFTIDSYTWRPVRADIGFNETETSIVIKKANLCGIEFPGILKVSSTEFEFYLNPVATDQNLGPTVTCLTDKENLADGTFDLNGELMAKTRPADLIKSLTGNLEFGAEQGRIYRFGLLAKIFALLNVTEIYRGEVPDLGGEGFAYNTMAANAVFEDGKLIIKESTIDSPSMGIACEGHIDLIKEKVNLIVLVAPFKTVDRIVKHIPVVGHILGGKLVSIPFRAFGNLDDPDVFPLEPTAVG
ncbi:MAG: AsmA-like C-terminal domain-containing protein [Desulfobacterales bacterium]|jgi:hypothetical protein